MNDRIERRPTRILFLTAVVVLGTTFAAGADARGAKQIDFNRDVRPILSDNCFQCHGPDPATREAGLRLDVEAEAKADRDGSHAVVAGSPEKSELVRRITSSDEFERMPPPDSGKSLKPAEIETLRRWIEQGAAWSLHWAYVRPARVESPDVENDAWPLDPLDRFILAQLEREGISPSEDADRVTLIRRLSFDLTGLPPTRDEVDAFVNDRSPEAYEKLVDRLLASDAYGERMAVYWLDLVRFADTVGYHGDQDHNITPYRDWVIDAFNDNVPFDRFTRDQLAGDLLPDATTDQKIATGYNRLLQTSHEGGVQVKEYLAIYAADRVRNLSAVWLGGTLGCAQCHDHKYDPYTSKDFYSMQAFFADVDEADHLRKGDNRLPTARPPEIEVLTKRERSEVAALEDRITDLKRTRGASDETSAAAASKKAVENQIAGLAKRRDEIQKGARKTMITRAIEPRTIRILPRGNWLDDGGEIVQPAVPEFLGAIDARNRRATRLDLARWLTDADAGAGLLTSRVAANRFWYLMFGRGLSPSLDDFGGQGQPPTHPQLLDLLAVDFVDDGWDVKRMLKRLAMSRAYRQTSVPTESLALRDPENRLFARQSRRRLPAEMIRDNALAVSGLLVKKIGGPSVKPYQPDGYYRHLNFPQRKYTEDVDSRQWRRGLYVHWQRQFLHPMLKAFDAPSREECTAQRPQSNTPLAALTLLNDPTFVEAARAFAARVLRDGGHDFNSRLEIAYQTAVSRDPDDFERKLLRRLYDESRDRFAANPQAAGKLDETGLSPVQDDVDRVELAAWTTITRAILNLNETNTRN